MMWLQKKGSGCKAQAGLTQDAGGAVEMWASGHQRWLGGSGVAHALWWVFLGLDVFSEWWRLLGCFGVLLWSKGATWCQEDGFGFALLAWWNPELGPCLQGLNQLNQQILLPMLGQRPEVDVV